MLTDIPIYPLAKETDDIKISDTLSFSKYMIQPNFKYGFHNWIHKIKETTKMFETDKTLKDKNFYLVTNPYEHQISNYDRDIKTMSEMYFNTDKNGIISRAFYKLWEILMMFDIIPHKGSIKTLHLAEAPGAFVQATALYRQKFYNNTDTKSDEYSCISIKGDIYFKEKLLKKTSNNIKILDIEDGDITKESVHKKLEKNINNVDLITADGGFVWKDENYQEQEAYRLLLAEIISAFKTQKKGGAFVLKIFETFTNITIKLICLLNKYYENVIIMKPLTSRPSNSERYLVCLKFKGINNKDIDKLVNILNEINIHEKKNLYPTDIFPEYQIPYNMELIITESSVHISNIQFYNINKRIHYIKGDKFFGELKLKGGNYFGDLYQKYLDEQIKANDSWINTFYPIDIKDIKNTKKNISDILEKSINNTTEKINKLKKNIKTNSIISLPSS